MTLHACYKVYVMNPKRI